MLINQILGLIHHSWVKSVMLRSDKSLLLLVTVNSLLYLSFTFLFLFFILLAPEPQESEDTTFVLLILLLCLLCRKTLLFVMLFLFLLLSCQVLMISRRLVQSLLLLPSDLIISNSGITAYVTMGFQNRAPSCTMKGLFFIDKGNQLDQIDFGENVSIDETQVGLRLD